MSEKLLGLNCEAGHAIVPAVRFFQPHGVLPAHFEICGQELFPSDLSFGSYRSEFYSEDILLAEPKGAHCFECREDDVLRLVGIYFHVKGDLEALTIGRCSDCGTDYLIYPYCTDTMRRMIRNHDLGREVS